MSHRDDTANNSREEQAGDIPMIESEMYFRVEWDAEGHATEDSVYAWLDGALTPSESSLVEAHVSGCETCAASVAEARGFIAASARILSVAEYVPQRVVPGADVARSAARIVALANAGAEDKSGTTSARVQSRSGKRSTKGGFRSPIAVGIAAAVVVMIGGSLLVLRERTASPARTPAIASTVAASAPRKDSITGVTGSPSKDARTPSTAAATKSDRPSRPKHNATIAARRAEEELRERARIAVVAESLALIRRSAPQAMPAVAIQAPASVQQEQKLGFSVATVAATDTVREITGRVVDAGTSEPLGAVQLLVAGSTFRGTTDNAGRFVLRDLPSNAQKVQFRRIGYAIVEVDIASLSNTNRPQDVRMSASVLALSAVVTTSTVGTSPTTSLRQNDERECTTAEVEFARSDSPIVRRIVLQRVSKSSAQGLLHDWPRSGVITPIVFSTPAPRAIRGATTTGDARIEISITMRDADWLADIREYSGSNVRAANARFVVVAGSGRCD